MARLLVIALILVACSPTDGSADSTGPPATTAPDSGSEPTEATTTTAVFGISSPAFEDGNPIPVEYTCDGADVSPELDVLGIPAPAESLVLVVEDPDAPVGVWDHWVEFDIPVDGPTLDIPRGAGEVGVAGVNSWNLPGYGGPCPPEGEEHTYSFVVYALDDTLDLPSGVDSERVYAAMEDLVISSVKLAGTYAR